MNPFALDTCVCVMRTRGTRGRRGCNASGRYTDNRKKHSASIKNVDKYFQEDDLKLLSIMTLCH